MVGGRLVTVLDRQLVHDSIWIRTCTSTPRSILYLFNITKTSSWESSHYVYFYVSSRFRRILVISHLPSGPLGALTLPLDGLPGKRFTLVKFKVLFGDRLQAWRCSWIKCYWIAYIFGISVQADDQKIDRIQREIIPSLNTIAWPQDLHSSWSVRLVLEGRRSKWFYITLLVGHSIVGGGWCPMIGNTLDNQSWMGCLSSYHSLKTLQCFSCRHVSWW